MNDYRAKRDKETALLVLMAAAMAVSAIVRWRLLGLPFERDEGEYAYMGSLLLKGFMPYTYAYSMKLPGIYAVYAIIMKVLGQTRAGVHGGLLVINALTSILVFILTRRLFGLRAAYAAGAAFAIASLNTHLHGIIANSEHFVIFFAVAGLCLITGANEKGRGPLWLFAGGFLLGLGVLMKQHGIFFLILGPLYIILAHYLRDRRDMVRGLKRSALVLVGGATPLLATCVIFYLAGGFGKLWFWTVTYSRLYVSSPPLGLGLSTFYRKFAPIFLTALPFWTLAGIGIVTLRGRVATRVEKAFTGLFAALSFLAIAPGLYFREHYFILLLPACSVLAGLGIDRLSGLLVRRRGSALAAVLILAATVPGLVAEHGAFFQNSPDEVSRRIFGPNPFPEAIRIADYIRSRSSGDETIAVLGSEPEIYFYSGRASATPFIYAYPLMEYQPMALEMQKEMIGRIEDKKPLYIVYVDIYNSWLRGRRSVGLIFDWFRFYWPGRYEIRGLVEIEPGGTRYVFGPKAGLEDSTGANSIIIYRRRDAA